MMNDRTKGVLIILAGVLIISPDAVLTRYLSEGGSDPWTTIFWKMLFAAPVSTAFAMYEAGGPFPLWDSVVKARVYYAVVMPLQATVDTCFVLSFFYTTAANALLLINLNPLWCAIAGRYVLGDTLPYRTCVALVLSLGCVLVIFVPDIIFGNGDDTSTGSSSSSDELFGSEYDSNEVRALAGSLSPELHQSSTKGNLIALFTGLGLATYITIVRHGSMRRPNPANLIGSTAGGTFLATVTALIVRRGDVLPDWNHGDDHMWQFWLVSLVQGIAVGAFFVAITIAPRLITGAEVGLCVLLEAILGPLFVYWAYGDAPSKWTVIGGSLLLLVLAVHEALGLGWLRCAAATELKPNPSAAAEAAGGGIPSSVVVVDVADRQQQQDSAAKLQAVASDHTDESDGRLLLVQLSLLEPEEVDKNTAEESEC